MSLNDYQLGSDLILDFEIDSKVFLKKNNQNSKMTTVWGVGKSVFCPDKGRQHILKSV